MGSAGPAGGLPGRAGLVADDASAWKPDDEFPQVQEGAIRVVGPRFESAGTFEAGTPGMVQSRPHLQVPKYPLPPGLAVAGCYPSYKVTCRLGQLCTWVALQLHLVPPLWAHPLPPHMGPCCQRIRVSSAFPNLQGQIDCNSTDIRI